MPQNTETHRELGALLYQESQLADALTHLQQAIQLPQDDKRTKELLEQARKRAEFDPGASGVALAPR
jgi:hypothetical protein